MLNEADLREGAALARESIASGAARIKAERLAALSRTAAGTAQ